MFNQISDISPLKKLDNLEILRLAMNEIKDISVLRELTNLRSLTSAGNKIYDIDSSDINYLEGLSWSPKGDYLAYKVLNELPITVDVQIINVSASGNETKFYSFAELSSKENPFTQSVPGACPDDLYRNHQWAEEGILLVTIGEGSSYGKKDILEAGVYKLDLAKNEVVTLN